MFEKIKKFISYLQDVKVKTRPKNYVYLWSDWFDPKDRSTDERYYDIKTTQRWKIILERILKVIVPAILTYFVVWWYPKFNVIPIWIALYSIFALIFGAINNNIYPRMFRDIKEFFYSVIEWIKGN